MSLPSIRFRIVRPNKKPRSIYAMKRGFVSWNAASADLERGVSVTEGNGAGQRPRPRSNRMTVVSALDDPLAVLLTDDLPDVMAPDDNRADRRTAGIAAVMRPGSREVVLRTRISPDLTAHVPSAPGGWPSPARRAHSSCAGNSNACRPDARHSSSQSSTIQIRNQSWSPQTPALAAGNAGNGGWNSADNGDDEFALLRSLQMQIATHSWQRLYAYCLPSYCLGDKDRDAIKGRLIKDDHFATASTMGSAAHLGQPP